MKEIELLLSKDPELVELSKALIMSKLDFNKFYNSFYHINPCDPMLFFKSCIDVITNNSSWFTYDIIFNTSAKEVPLQQVCQLDILQALKNCLSNNNENDN